ncbi:class I SAM-dependent methyltransferase [Reyranella sp.]|uniref:class I SAM-dependent methyltransferase n=1 Tax=Reyranella sp. TaxID=1929291 RepID=UPI003D0E7E2C
MSKATSPQSIRTDPPPRDPWLDCWLGLIGERAAGLPLLELGCGGGRDTAVLVAAGHSVVGLDLSPRAIANARARVPMAEFHCQDVRGAWPMPQAGAVIASLSLHYFPWSETEALVNRIADVLRPGGLLLCRLSSTNDRNFGARDHPRIDEHFYSVDGAPKRFFDRAAVDRLFASGWRLLGAEELTIDRYDLPKVVWQVVLEKS